MVSLTLGVFKAEAQSNSGQKEAMETRVPVSRSLSPFSQTEWADESVSGYDENLSKTAAISLSSQAVIN